MYHLISTSPCLTAYSIVSIIMLCSETPDNSAVFLMNYLAHSHQLQTIHKRVDCVLLWFSLSLSIFSIFTEITYICEAKKVLKKKKNGIHYSDADCKFIWMKQNSELNTLILYLVTSEFLLLILFLLSSNQMDWICIGGD